jgi:glutathione S-transferase
MILELYQTEWCPASRRVRERLTELGLDYLVHQVPVEREERTALLEATGADTIPALLLEDGGTVVGEEASRSTSTSASTNHPGPRRTA